ncbi:MAG: flagellar protein FlaG [Treponema sp.]|jgi:flagellar protein FlaG|nr:flagellar protein FlaG [Treponema sp.]
MTVASVRTGVATPQELSPGQKPVQRARSQAAQERAEFINQLEAAIPGKGSGEQKSPVLDSVAADLERISLAFNKRLQFVVDHRSNEVTVKVIDRETDKVIKVLPPEELQRLHRTLKETIGFLFDERV